MLTPLEQLFIELKALQDAAQGVKLSDFQSGYIAGLAYAIRILTGRSTED